MGPSGEKHRRGTASLGKWQEQLGLLGVVAHWLNGVEATTGGDERDSNRSQVIDYQSMGQALGSSPQFS